MAQSIYYRFLLLYPQLSACLRLQRLKIEAQVFDNLANNIHLDAAGVSLVVEQSFGFSIKITSRLNFEAH